MKVLCACGCGQLRDATDKKGRPRRFVYGHSGRLTLPIINRKPRQKIERDRTLVLCACGCGEKLECTDDRRRPRRFIANHSGRVTTTEDVRAKISAKLTGIKRTHEERQKTSATRKRLGLSFSPEAREKAHAVVIAKGSWRSGIEAAAKSNAGRPVSAETRNKLSAANKGQKPSEIAIRRSTETRTSKALLRLLGEFPDEFYDPVEG